jgi:hypothetical protein
MSAGRLGRRPRAIEKSRSVRIAGIKYESPIPAIAAVNVDGNCAAARALPGDLSRGNPRGKTRVDER